MLADVLRGAEKVVVIWGERIGREGEEAVEALLDVGEALGLGGSEGSGLMEVPDVANARGLREAGCLPDAGPGLKEIYANFYTSEVQKTASVGKGTEEIREGLEAGEIETLVLFGADPLRDFPDTAAWESALTAAKNLIVFSTFETATTAKADLVLPLETHAEKDGTVTHPDGRLQRVRPSASRPGDIRPNWGVLAEIALELGLDTGIDSQPTALAALTAAVPFYAGIDDAAIAGRGIRWQETASASSLPAPEPGGFDARASGTGAPSSLATRRSDGGGLSPDSSSSSRAKRSEGVPVPPAGAPALVLGTYRDLWAGPITELNPPLKFLRPRQTLELSPADAEALGLEGGDEVRVSQNGTSVTARVAIRERVEPGVCFLAEGTEENNANQLLNGSPVSVTVERLPPAAAAPGERE